MFTQYDLSALKKAHPLPAGIEDLVCNLAELSAGLGKSQVMIARYRDGGMPVLSQGGNGQSYEFQLSDCWAWYHGMKSGISADKANRNLQLEQLRLALVGDDASDDMLSLSPKQRAEEYEAARRYGETAVAQGKLVYRAQMVFLLESVFGVVRSQMFALPDVMERRVGLTPEQAETMEKIAKETVASLSEVLANSNLAIAVDERPRKKVGKK